MSSRTFQEMIFIGSIVLCFADLFSKPIIEQEMKPSIRFPHTHKKLIVIRGLPGSGKSTITDKLKDIYIAQNQKVGTLHWDKLFTTILPEENLTDPLIIHITETLVNLCKYIYSSRNFDIMILDGLFLLPQEHDLLLKLACQFDKFLIIRLDCMLSQVLQRNTERSPSCYVESDRIIELANDINWNIHLPHEIVIKNDGNIEQSIKEILEIGF